MGYSLYRGYVETIGKEAVAKYKTKDDAQLDTLDAAQRYAGYAGVLASETVMLDADSAGQASALSKAINALHITARLMRTKRGMHVTLRDSSGLVKDCCQGVELMCGIVVDIKTGRKASYDVLKIDGRERMVLADADDTHDYSTLPACLSVFRKMPKGLKESKLFGLADGDGRDNAMYGRIKDLVRKGLSDADIKQCVQIINSCVFKDPLDDATIQKFWDGVDSGLYRAEVEEEDKNKVPDLYIRNENDKVIGIDFEAASDYLIERMGICRMYGDIVWIACEDGTYRATEDAIELRIMDTLRNIREGDTKEIMRRVLSRAPIVEPAPTYLVAFKNGALDLRTMTMSPITPEMHLTNMIPHEYHADAYDALMDKTITKLTMGDKELRMMIEESIGQCLFRSNKAKAAYVYLGRGDSGKSTLLDIIEKVVGEENRCCVPVDELGKQFGLDELAGKIANVCDELPENFTKSEATNRLKNLTSGGMFSVDRKYVNKRLKFYPYCGCIYATNALPGMTDSSGVARDRLKLVPFENKFSKKDPDYDPFIADKLSTEQVYQYIVKIGIDGLKRYLTQGYLTESEKSRRASEMYAAQCDSVIEWLQSYLEKSSGATKREQVEEMICDKMPEQLHLIYTAYFSSDSSRRIVGRNTFYKRVESYCSVTKRKKRNMAKGGVPTIVYVLSESA